MAVGAPNFALADLVHQRCHTHTPADNICYVAEFRSAHMIKIQNYRVCLTTVNTGVRQFIIFNIAS